jgi:hypothetical protein
MVVSEPAREFLHLAHYRYGLSYPPFSVLTESREKS